MSKTGVNSSPMKQETNPYRKDNRGSHMNDKRNSDSFSKSNQNNRDRSRPDRSRDDFSKRGDGANDDDKNEKSGESTSTGEKKFTGRCRLFVGNLTPDITEADFRKMFETFGEISEVYVNTSRGFGFIRLDYRQNAEAAKAALDGTQRKGRILRVRFATHGAALKVKNLHPYVSNELLEQSFSQFGELERCIVIVDDRGKSTGEGIVEFVRKPGANSALRRINEGVFLMGVDPKPVAVEPLEQKDEEDGMPEKFITKTDQYKKEREKEPRFAPPGTFEYEFGMRWKQLEEVEKQRIDQVKKDTEESRLKLEDEMQNALYEYQAEQIRQDLIRQQEELRRLEELRNSDRMRRQQEMEMRRQQDDRERAQQEERRRDMIMRQQDMARGRSGPLDPPGMRSREEMMMAERFGDRMPDRMGDRMPDRMGDRMGQGSGFNMWQDEKQRSEAMRNEAMRNEAMRNEVMRGDANMRNEASLRNEGGRGRDMRGPGSDMRGPGADMRGPGADMRGPGADMRGPGASPHQGGPSGPQSGMGNMERGGPPSSSASGTGSSATPNVKSSPKPLMQPGGNFGMGSQNNNVGPNNMGNSGGDNNNMENTEDAKPDLEVGEPSQVVSVHDRMEEHSSTADGSLSSSEHVVSEKAPPDTVSSDEGRPEAVPSSPLSSDCLDSESCKWKESSEYWSNGNDSAIVSNSLSAWESDVESVKESSSSSCVVSSRRNSGDSILHSEILPRAPDRDECSCNDAVMLEKDVEETTPDQDIVCVLGNHDDSKSNKYQNRLSVDDSEISQVKGCENNDNTSINIPVTNAVLAGYATQTENSDKVLSQSENCHSLRNVCVQSYISSNSNPCSISTQAQSHYCKNTSTNVTLSYSTIPTGQDITLMSTNPSCKRYESISKEGEDVNEQGISMQTSCLSKTAPASYQTVSPVKICTQENLQQDLPCHSQCADEVQIQSTSVTSNEFHSHANYADPHYTQCDSSSVSSYKQRLFEDSESVEEEMEDEDSVSRKVVSNDYQSYDNNVPISQYMPSPYLDSIQLQEVCFKDLTLENEQMSNSDNTCSYIRENKPSLYPTKENMETYSSAVKDSENAMNEDCSPQNDGQVPVVVSSPSHVSIETAEDNTEGALRTGDQSFKVTTQESSSQDTATTGTSGVDASSYSGADASSYSGANIIQGAKQPSMLSSSTVHIAQHQGATIMQHQSMTAGYSGGMAQSTVVQKQALGNGMQTALVQQRTITNGGQTMVVQQQTMTNVLGGGLAQQTMVQQRIIPSAVAHSAAMQVQALRQRALATQQAQASMIQQQALRMAHSQARVVGSPLLQAQTLGKSAVIQQAGSSPYIGRRLVQASPARGSVMQHLIRQRYMGSPVLPARGVQMISGRPVRVKLAYSRDSLGFHSNT